MIQMRNKQDFKSGKDKKVSTKEVTKQQEIFVHGEENLSVHDVIKLLMSADSVEHILEGREIIISDKCDPKASELLLVTDAHSFDPFVFSKCDKKLYAFMYIDKSRGKEDQRPLYENDDVKCVKMYAIDYREHEDYVAIENIVLKHKLITKNQDEPFKIDGKNVYIGKVIKNMRKKFSSLPLRIDECIRYSNSDKSEQSYYNYSCIESIKKKYPFSISIDVNNFTNNIPIDHEILFFLKDARTARDLMIGNMVNLDKLPSVDEINIDIDTEILFPFLITIRLIDEDKMCEYLSEIIEDHDLMKRDRGYLIKCLKNPENMKRIKNMTKKANKGHNIHTWCDDKTSEFKAIQPLCEMFDFQRHWDTKDPIEYYTIESKHFLTFLCLIYQIKMYVMELR
jgi:hypothetical protein